VRFILVLLIVVTTPGRVVAEQIILELDEVVVTASRVEKKLKEASVTVNVVSGKEMEKVRFRNPGEVLTRFPGIYTHDFGGESEITSIRVPTHFTNPYTLVLVDGMPTASYGCGSSSRFREINSGNIARIEIVKGPASALYGSNAIGGIINVITRRPSVKPQIKIWSEYGEDEQWRSGISGSGGSETLSFNMDMNHIDSDGWREHSAQNKKAGNIKLQYLPTEQSLLTLKLDYLNFEHESSGSIRETDFLADWRQSYHTFAGNRMDKFSSALTYTYFFETAEFRSTLALRDIDHEVIPDYAVYQQTFGPFPRPYVGSLSKTDSRDVDLQMLYSKDLAPFRAKIITGFDVERADKETDTNSLAITWDADRNKYTSYTVGDLSKSYDITTEVEAPYLQLEASFPANFRLIAGGRYDSTKYDVKDKLNTGNSGEKNFSRFSPKIGAVCDILPSMNTYINYSKGFVVPTTSQLLTSRYANSGLQPEDAINYEIGLRGSFLQKRFDLDLALYSMDITHKIVLSAADQYVNAGKTSQKGVEALATIMPSENLRLTLAYTYARNKYDTFFSGGTDYSGNWMPRSPKHRLNARLAVLPLEGLEVELEMDAVSSQYADDNNANQYSRPTLFNLRAGYDRGEWSFWAHIKNLTDREYATYVSFSSADGVNYYSGHPMTFFAGVSYKWSK
jgi:iron complex outermembrane receptor protein